MKNNSVTTKNGIIIRTSLKEELIKLTKDKPLKKEQSKEYTITKPKYKKGSLGYL